jgi:peptide/nickel transport system substrate-binding protein
MATLRPAAQHYSGAMMWGPFGGSSTPTRRRLLVGAAAAVLVFTACGGSGHGHAHVGDTLSGAGAFDPDRTAPAAPIKGAVKGGTVTVLTSGDFGHFGPDQDPADTLDPTGSYFLDISSVLSGLVTRSLTQYVYDPDSGSVVLVPDIATDLGTPNADFTQWTFTIRDGVRFEDGSTVSADDVAYGIKRSLDRHDFPDSARYSTDYFLDGKSYKGPYLSGDQYAGVVVDGNTLTIKMARPFPDMPYWAAFPAVGPIPQIGSSPATYWRHPMATGPYKFGKYVPGKSLTLVQNDQWDPATDPGRHAYPDRYVFEFHQHPGRSEATVLGGSARGRTALSYDNVSTANRSEAQRRGRLASGPASCTFMVWPDNRKITDIRVREALGYAFPYRAYVALNGGALGVTDLPGASLLPLGLPGRQDYTVLDAQPGETNPHKARVLLRRAGYAPGDYTITFLYVSDSPAAIARKDQLVKSLHAAGFATHPIHTTSQGFGTIQNDPHAPIKLRFGGWCSDWASGSAWFPHLLASDGDANYAYFAEPSVDSAIDRIARLPLDQQPAAWGTLDKEVMTHYYPGVVASYSAAQMVHGASIGGMNVDPLLGMPTWKDIYVRT